MRAARLSITLVALGLSTAAAAEGNVYLSQAKVFYQGLEFEKCVQRVEQAARVADSTREELAEVELYSALCRFNLGKRDEAQAHFKMALELNPDVKLPPETSPRIVEVFQPMAEKVRAQRAPKDAPTAVSLAPQPSTTAQPEVVASPEREGKSRVLPLALGGTSVAAAGLAAVFGVMAKNHEAQANDRATFYSDAQTLGNDARREALVANVALGVAATAAAGAVVTWLMAE